MGDKRTKRYTAIFWGVTLHGFYYGSGKGWEAEGRRKLFIFR
jgi:hypothetical protein